MVELVVLEQAAARQRVKRAEQSLKQAKAMLEESCGLAVSLALCARIRAEQRHARAAKRRLLTIASLTQ
ncbi:hypothetical protein EN836_17925 [Mesorhizobium sp. M1C.F.Ca.ET.193.01.1.1]|uniref:hypothetical protein n=1 Tax=unclassified Mesorhizobium TaxID=325217 RepID=UPI000FD59049|nr:MULTISPECIES: hypothetical protein [unclassified Mesorhizobium]TGS98146.1 hypothetical protein EN820_36655 [bacterium M00.F.Ca.ET.177.01.1.1]RWA61210.1 MAG: hypothetical protein EOQ28_31805 [Mesorhizobium sp.]RWC05932.1 MAG: hypothetical protein EOQ57_01915 [Mesorhizobium sp.]RWG80722.1 MAG: hypothetical protein EOQ70_26355 [Mesorhizobium sp.]RWG88386.1 MAG: hypothetical protein EOQ69_00125 [Mesorhizobium sp.]